MPEEKELPSIGNKPKINFKIVGLIILITLIGILFSLFLILTPTTSNKSEQKTSSTSATAETQKLDNKIAILIPGKTGAKTNTLRLVSESSDSESDFQIADGTLFTDGKFLLLKGSEASLVILNKNKLSYKKLLEEKKTADGYALLESLSVGAVAFSHDSKKVTLAVQSSKSDSDEPLSINKTDVKVTRTLRTYETTSGKELGRLTLNEMPWTLIWGSGDTLLGQLWGKDIQLIKYDIKNNIVSNGWDLDLTIDSKTVGLDYLFGKGQKLIYTLVPSGSINTAEDEIWSIGFDGKNKEMLWKATNLKTCGTIDDVKPNKDLSYLYIHVGCEGSAELPTGKVGLMRIMLNIESKESVDLGETEVLSWSPTKDEFVGRDKSGVGVFSIKGVKVKQLYSTDQYIPFAYWY